MKKPTILLSLLLILVNFVSAQDTYNLLVGTYTNADNPDGIYVYSFNTQNGDYSLRSKISGVENPSYLAISNDKKHVYSVNEVRDNGGASSFNFNASSGELTFINRVSSGGNSPAYISVDDQNQFVFVANYRDGSLSAIKLVKDGSLSNEIQTIPHSGSSINQRRQSGPHVHCTILTPDNKFLLATDLGIDKVFTYQFNPQNIAQPLTPANPPFISVTPGNGPRHITFHPNKKYAYLICEMGGTVTTYDYSNGKLKEKQTVPLSSPEFTGSIGGADIHISADGKFLYASNRGDANEIVIFSINNDGTLNLVGRQSTLGKKPRNFVIDPSGKYLLVANQDTNDIFIFNRNQKTGMLSPTGKKIQIHSPVCLKFVSN